MSGLVLRVVEEIAVPEFDLSLNTPLRITFDVETVAVEPAGPTQTRRMSDLEGLFADQAAWEQSVADGDPIVYTVASTPVPEQPTHVPQSITTISPGAVAGEFYLTKGHQHPDPQGEIYLGLAGAGGLLLFDGQQAEWVDMAPGVIGYIPPHWAHRSINVGDEPYKFLAVYPGSAGHDYRWVLDNGMGKRAYRTPDGYDLRPH